VVRDLENDVLDIGEKATPVEDNSSHVERRMKGQVVFLTREDDGVRRAKVRSHPIRHFDRADDWIGTSEEAEEGEDGREESGSTEGGVEETWGCGTEEESGWEV
jgi:hypothetical protein